MTLDEATAALAANPAALYLAGRDADDIIQTFLKPPIRPGVSNLNPIKDGMNGNFLPDIFTAEELQYPADNQMVRDFRDSLVGADQPTTLMLTTNAATKFAAILAARQQNKTDEAAAREQQRRDHAQANHERAKQRAFAERASRATHPAFAILKSRIMAAESTIGQASSPSDFADAEQILADAFTAATTSVALGLSSVLPAS